MLEGLYKNFALVKVNKKFFESEFEPISIIYKFLNMLNKWPEKHHNARIIRDSMSPVYDNLSVYRDNSHLRTELVKISEEFIKD